MSAFNVLSAHAEVIGHLTKGLELLKTLPDTPERTRQELEFLTTLGPTLIATKGICLLRLPTSTPELRRSASRQETHASVCSPSMDCAGGLWRERIIVPPMRLRNNC
jgi:hypothetical protein